MKNQQILLLHEDIAKKQPIVFFDGDCSLCSSSVRFLLRHNPAGNLSFASLQSETGLKIVQLAGNKLNKADTLLLLQDNELSGYSTAALKITAHLSFPFHLLRIFIFIPAVIRDAFYRFIASNRYKWFGTKSFCMADNQEYQERFII